MSRAQALRILDRLLCGQSLTAVEAFRQFGCFRLAARIEELRKAGHAIETEWINDRDSGKRYARYRLRRGQAELPGMRRSA